MKTYSLSLVALAFSLAVTASAGDLLRLGTHQEGYLLWVLYYDQNTNKLKLVWEGGILSNSTLVGQHQQEWWESSILELESSGAIVNRRDNYLVCFKASDVPPGSVIPKRYFLRMDQCEVAGRSCQIFAVEKKYRVDRLGPDGVVTYTFTGPMKPWFSFIWPK